MKVLEDHDLGQCPFRARHTRRKYPLSTNEPLIHLSPLKPTPVRRGITELFLLVDVVARRLGLYSSSEKRPLTRSNGDVFSDADTIVVFKSRRLEVICSLAPRRRRRGGGGDVADESGGGGRGVGGDEQVVVTGFFVWGYERSEESEDEFCGERRRLSGDLGEDAAERDLGVVDVEGHFELCR